MYANRCDKFNQKEYKNIFNDTNNNYKCACSLLKIFRYLAQTEFHEIILWSENFTNINRARLSKIIRSDDSGQLNANKSNLNEKIRNILETITILSHKIQQ